MKSYLTTALLALSLGLPVAVRADHTVSEGIVEQLHNDVHRLEADVNYSTLSSSVKRAVSRLEYDVSSFYTCVTRSSQDDHTVTTACERVFQRVRSSWNPVNRYLYDTSLDYPQVYRDYAQVYNDLRYFPF